MIVVHKRKLLLAAIGLLSVVVLAVLILKSPEPALETAAPVVNWGLSFQKEGETPRGNVSAQELRKFDAYFVGDETEKKIYLTFDCGYENGNTPAILEALKKHGAKATFFAVGNFLSDNRELIGQIVKEGHTVGNHTFSHPDMSAISSEQSFREELAKNEALYREITGGEMAKFYRPPQGKFSEENLKMAQKLSYQTIFWSLAYVDWYVDDQPDPEEAIALLTKRIHPGAIVLLHNTSKTNAKILDRLLTKWENLGYSFTALDELAKAKR